MIDLMIPQGGGSKSGLNSIVVSGEVNITKEKAGFQDSPEGIEDMQAHYFAIHNPEKFYTLPQICNEYRRMAKEQAEAFLVADGYKLIGQKPEVSLFPFIKD